MAEFTLQTGEGEGGRKTHLYVRIGEEVKMYGCNWGGGGGYENMTFLVYVGYYMDVP